MNASELKEKVRRKWRCIGDTDIKEKIVYVFDEDEMAEYEKQLCEEQRQNCVEFFINGGNRQGSFIAEDLLNAPEPE